MSLNVSVVIVTYQSAEVLRPALDSLPPGVEITVVDNNSQDGSALIAAEAGASVLRNDRNLGFGTACNQGAAAGSGGLILFLNPDATLTEGSLETLCAALTEVPDLAAVGPLLRSNGEISPPRKASLLEQSDPTFADVPDAPVEVGFLSGAALLVRREAFEAIGGFDENIFLYLEDDDLCIRLREAGYKLMLHPKAVVLHDKEPNAQSSSQSLRFRNRHTQLSTRYLAKKHGVEIALGPVRRKAWRRLVVALLTFDRARVHINIGRLQGLGVWPFSTGQDL